MSQLLLPGELSPVESLDIIGKSSSASFRLLLRRPANRFLNRMRQRAMFNEMMAIDPWIRDDIGLTPAVLAARMQGVCKDQEAELPKLGACMRVLWRGIVTFNDPESRRFRSLAEEEMADAGTTSSAAATRREPALALRLR